MSTDTVYVRTDMIAAQPAPNRSSGTWAWMRKNLFATPTDTALTVLGLLLLFWLVPPLFNFFIGHAVFPGGTVEDCRAAPDGACWAYIGSEIEFFIYGFYPMQEYWRPNIVFFLLFALIIPLLAPKVPFKRTNAVLFFVVFPIFSFFLLSGLDIRVTEDSPMFGVLNSLGLLSTRFGIPEGTLLFMPYVPTEQWGGLLVTLIISVVGISLSLPLEIADWSGLSLVVGAAIAEALDPNGRRLGLKWPNDLWLDERKLGGILIETVPAGSSRMAVIGVGLNVSDRAKVAESQLNTGFACLQELLPDITPPQALARLAPVLVKALAAFPREGFGAWRERFAI